LEAILGLVILEFKIYYMLVNFKGIHAGKLEPRVTNGIAK
jgi:hypothetical protein